MSTPVNPRFLLPDDLAETVDLLTAELRHRAEQLPALDAPARERRFRTDVPLCSRLLSIYKTVADIQRRDPNAAPLDPAQFLPSHIVRGLRDTEKYLADLVAAWSDSETHPTDAQFDAALTALCRVVALRRSCWDLARACPRPENFTGWDPIPPADDPALPGASDSASPDDTSHDAEEGDPDDPDDPGITVSRFEPAPLTLPPGVPPPPSPAERLRSAETAPLSPRRKRPAPLWLPPRRPHLPKLLGPPTSSNSTPPPPMASKPPPSRS